MLWVWLPLRARCTTLCNNVCQWLVAFLRVVQFPPPLFSITSLFWEHVYFTKPWDMSWLILKFKMYLLDISVYIGNILTVPVFCKKIKSLKLDKTPFWFELWYHKCVTQCDADYCRTSGLPPTFFIFSNIILTAGYLLESYYSHFHCCVGVYAPSLPNMQ
jgi:hypothetical protein